MTDQLTEQQVIDYAMAYNLILSIEVCKEYIEAIIPVMVAKKANYAYNKANDSYNSIIKLSTVLDHEFFKSMSPEYREVYRQVIDNNKELMYMLFSLDPDKQHRVKGLIQKLINER